MLNVQGVLEKSCPIFDSMVWTFLHDWKCLVFIKFYQLESVGYLNVANGWKSLLDLFPDVNTIFNSEVFEANIWTLKTPTRPFLNSSLFWQPPEFGNVKERS